MRAAAFRDTERTAALPIQIRQGTDMDPQRLPGNISSLKTAAPAQPPKSNRRLHKRFATDEISLTFLGVDHVVLNWSVDGVLVADRHPDLAIGTTVSGVLSVRGLGGRFRFSAKLLRRDLRTKEIAFHFVEPSRALVDALSRLTDRT